MIKRLFKCLLPCLIVIGALLFFYNQDTNFRQKAEKINTLPSADSNILYEDYQLMRWKLQSAHNFFVARSGEEYEDYQLISLEHGSGGGSSLEFVEYITDMQGERQYKVVKQTISKSGSMFDTILQSFNLVWDLIRVVFEIVTDGLVFAWENVVYCFRFGSIVIFG